jgi:hypothetical protein
MGPLALFEVTLDCPAPRALAEFYRRALGWAYAPGHQTVDQDGDEWLVLLPPAGGSRVHLDVAVPEPAAAHEHLVGCGARPLTGSPAEEGHAEDLFRVHADPAGHPFCATQVGRAAARPAALTARPVGSPLRSAAAGPGSRTPRRERAPPTRPRRLPRSRCAP